MALKTLQIKLADVEGATLRELIREDGDDA